MSDYDDIRPYYDNEVPGVLARVTFDTTGISTGVYALAVANTLNGPTDFVSASEELVDGWIVVIDSLPELLLTSTPGGMELTYSPLPGFEHFVQFRDRLTSGPDWQDYPGGPHQTGLFLLPDSAVAERYVRLRLQRSCP